jgi:excisionase family DNA binding protein
MQVSDLISDAFSTEVYLNYSYAQKSHGVSPGSNVTKRRCSSTYRKLQACCDPTNSEQMRKVWGVRKRSQKGARTFLCGGHQHPLLFLRKKESPFMYVDHPHALSIRETAKALGVSRSTVYRLINDGELDRSYIRSLPRIMPEDIDRYLRKIARDQKIREASDDPWR